MFCPFSSSSSFAFLASLDTIPFLNLAAPISACLALSIVAGSCAVKTIAEVLIVFFFGFWPNGSTFPTNFS